MLTHNLRHFTPTGVPALDPLVEAETYKVTDPDLLTPDRVQAIRRKVAASTKEFERQFRISARTMETYEQGRRRPDAAMQTLLRVIEREPDAVRRALAAAACPLPGWPPCKRRSGRRARCREEPVGPWPRRPLGSALASSVSRRLGAALSEAICLAPRQASG